MLIEQKISPLLKWAGGKNSVIPQLSKFFPSDFNDYHEPFIGGGAVFFSLARKGSKISDSNQNLINFYNQVAHNLDNFVANSEAIQNQFNENTAMREELFYSVRERFNDGYGDASQRAADFIFLNKTAFNGMYRENRAGKFNVPYNKMKSALKLFDSQNLRNASELLSSSDINSGDYREVAATAQKGDFVYFDPPYVPLTETANFTSYQSSGFDLANQAELLELAQCLKKEGVKVLISNSSADWVIQNYSRAGFEINYINAKRLIGGSGASRDSVQEVVIA